MITFQSLTQTIQADYVKEATSKDILRAVSRVISDLNSKMPMIEEVYLVSETYVTGALTGDSATKTITGANSQFANLAIGDHFNVSDSVSAGETDLNGNYTIVTKTSDNEVVVSETVGDGASATGTKVNYMYNATVHVTYDYELNTLEIVDAFIEIRDILVDDDEYEIVTDYVFENADSTDEYLRFLDRKTIEFISDVTDSDISFRMIKQLEAPDTTSDDIDIPEEYREILILGVAYNLMLLPKFHSLYKDSFDIVRDSYIAEFTARAKHEYDRYPNKSIELEYKY